MIRQDGEFTWYTIQHRLIGESPWGKPKGKITKVKDRSWAFSSFDVFDFVTYGTKSSDEVHDVWNKIGSKGWWTQRAAVKAMLRAIKSNLNGHEDSVDPYGKKMQARRHEFRVVKITVSQKVEPV